ncbi:MAG: hypothetical protein R3264_21520 [Anaerolineae bacterium]|nr:hypothetical protein [Anaerolineae bacterium]
MKTTLKNLLLRLGITALLIGGITAGYLKLNEKQSSALVDLSDVSVQSMTTAADGKTMYLNLVDDVQPSGLYRSRDNGVTWEMVSANPDLIFNTLAVDPVEKKTLFAGTDGGPLGTTNNVWRSTDGGKTWHNFNLSLPASPDRIVPAVTAVLVDPHQPEILYVGTDGQGVYRFKDGEVGFELVGGVSLYSAHVKDLAVGADGRLYTLTADGLFATEGETWQKLATPETPVSLAIASDDAAVMYLGSPSTGAYRSADGGQTWQSISVGLDQIPGAALRVPAVAVDELASEHVFVATAYGLGGQFAPGGLYESTDGGQTWTKMAELDKVVNQLYLDDGVIIAATDHGLTRYGTAVEDDSTTAPSFWQRILDEFIKPAQNPGSAPEVAPRSPDGI